LDVKTSLNKPRAHEAAHRIAKEKFAPGNIFEPQDRLAGAPLREERRAQRSRQQPAGERRRQQDFTVTDEEIAARRFAQLVTLV